MRWQFAHTKSHFAISARMRSMLILLLRMAEIVNDFSETWSKSIT